MAQRILCYIGISGQRISEIANVVSLHLSFLYTGASDTKLVDIEKIIVEKAERAVMSVELYDQFRQLEKVNADLASNLIAKLLHQAILAILPIEVFHNVKSKLSVLPYASSNDPADTILIDINRIDIDKSKLAEAVNYHFQKSADYHMEKIVKKVFEQAAQPRFEDLTLSQANLLNGQQELNTNLLTGLQKVSQEQAAMEKRLLDAISGSRTP